MLATIVASVTTILTFAGIFYYIAVLWSGRSFVRRRPPISDFAPPVSILKPVRGLDPGMYEAFASHCRQEYPGDYEILFGVSSLDDPAEAPVLAAIDRLKAEFPERGIRLIECPEKLGPNGKMGNVVQLARHARHDYLLVNDSDIRVGPRYLTRVMSEFATAHNGKAAGLVTAPYRGQAHGTLGSKLEALGISTDFFPGVLVSLKLDGEIRFGLGSTLAVSRPAVDAIGGFAPLVDSLADDYELGQRIAQAGFAVVLSREVVETSVPAYTLSGYLAHQLRWARGIRDSRRAGYIGLVFTFGLSWAILNTIASGFALDSLALLSLACLARVTTALAVGLGLLADRQVLRDLWLLPLRDLAAMGVWVWSFAGNTITWRGETFTLENGVLKPVSSDPSR
ncbi:MAG TPA: bacteriohopanetetrol glucosamine biosynthesis glycosyltransferase HpnI [Acidobacteriaceae bacterium]|nr:bacteriohopanetetrol glucosamine biosynthesis glycosyltransferase HpnI [Acidobacteriaceae bacterium]